MSRKNCRPAPVRCFHFFNGDGKRVARQSALNVDGAGKRVKLFLVKLRKVIFLALLCDLPRGNLIYLEFHWISGFDVDDWFVFLVPKIVESVPLYFVRTAQAKV